MLKLEPLLKKQAEANLHLSKGRGEKGLNKCAKVKLSTGDKIIASEMSAMATGKKFDTRAALGKTAGVSARLIDEGKLINQHADDETKTKLRENQISIHRVAKDIKEKIQRDSRQEKRTAASANATARLARTRCHASPFSRQRVLI